MIDAEQRVLDAARDWFTERAPGDAAEKALAVAVARAWPEDLACREDCTCGESESCDECPTRAETEAQIKRWEQESTPIAESQ